jgi:23S rRNA pseudouridine955/2504/2580 synthase/23S rRNA pseudouridine1911/1915/1917 synthase
MQKLKYEVLMEDEHMLAVSKPSGMLTLPDRHDGELQSLRGLLQAKYGEIFVVHRLDKDTSGAILFAKDEATHKYLSQLFENRLIEKKYLAIVHGKPDPASGDIEEPIAEHPGHKGTMIISHKGKAAHTSYEVVEGFGKFSLVSFTLHTGRTHQIRVHSKFIGYPVACDPIYGDGKPVMISSFKKKFHLAKHDDEERPILSRLGLHAHQLKFTGMDGKEVLIEAPLFKDMRALLAQLEKVK